MQVLRQLPTIFVPLVAKLFLMWSGSMYYVGSRLRMVVRQRLEEREQGNEKARVSLTLHIES